MSALHAITHGLVVERLAALVAILAFAQWLLLRWWPAFQRAESWAVGTFVLAGGLLMPPGLESRFFMVVGGASLVDALWSRLTERVWLRYGRDRSTPC